MEENGEFLNHSTVMSLVLHELGHLVYFEHSLKFRVLLKFLYAKATSIGIFDPREKCELRSHHEWERALYATGGFISRKYITVK